MERRSARPRIVAAVGALSVALIVVVLLPSTTASAKDGTLKQIAEGHIRPAVLTTPAGVRRALPSLSGSMITTAVGVLQQMKAASAQRVSHSAAPSSTASLGIAPETLGCADRNSDGDVRVNQDCTYRPQAEESIIYDPAAPSNLVAGLNDTRVGFNQCGIAWSLNSGDQWGDQLPPFRSKLNTPDNDGPVPGDPNTNTLRGDPGTLHTYDSASDPGVAIDSRGNAYVSCVMFDLFSNAFGVFVVHSPAQARGSFFFNIGPFDRKYIVVEDNSPDIIHDKPFSVADKFSRSPNRDNVYVTWSVFRSSTACGAPPNGIEQECESTIFGSMSTDQGHTWSTPEEISGTSPLCFQGNAFDSTLPPNACDLDQGPDPTVLPNGDLEVVFNNDNTAPDNPAAQQLGVHCKPSGSSSAGTAHLNCAQPAKVGDDVIAGEPVCDFGRGPEECIPGAFIRTNDFPRDNKNVNGNTLFATWPDYRNGEFDIQLSRSTDGGLHWQELGTVNPDRGRDHYFPDVDVAPRDTGRDDDSGRVGVSYFRTARVANENVPPAAGFSCPTGAPPVPSDLGQLQCPVAPANSDYVLSGATAAHTPFEFKVVSPQFAPPDGIDSGFNGDFSGLTITPDGRAHPIWSDTRNTNPFPENGSVHDEDIFTTSTDLPQ